MQVASHAPLSRVYTAPLAQGAAFPNMHPTVSATSSLAHSQAHTSSSYSLQSALSPRASDTTVATSTSTLFHPPPPLPTSTSTPANGGPIEPTNNVMNKVADKETSLFQICMTLRQRLSAVHGFETFFANQKLEYKADQKKKAEEDAEARGETKADAKIDTTEIDIVTLIWHTFRKGRPLVVLYETLRPDLPITVDISRYNEEKQGKALTSSFLRYCINELQFDTADCFIIYDLYADDTTGFVKVTKMVSRLLDLMVARGLIEDIRPDEAASNAATKRSQRQHIVDELVRTERTYVQHLELLQSFKQLCESKGVITGDVSHRIFHNLDALLNFQRRFLIRVEQVNAQPEEEQNWGKVFINFSDSFNVYEFYIANQKLCEETVMKEFNKLKEAGGSIEHRQMVDSAPTLYGFLMKPFQRLSKYPLLLNELYRKGDFDDARKEDLARGKECATIVLTRTNTAIENEDKLEAVEELKGRVEDWKGHRVEGFGDLLLFGTYTVLKSDIPPGRDQEREYHIYFFESILLCCKDIDRNKPKNKMSSRPLLDKKGKTRLQLKGRIFMQNVTDIISASKSGSYTTQIFWKGDPGIENFTIRFASEETMTKWNTRLLEQKKKWDDSTQPTNLHNHRPSGTSDTQFTYMQGQPAIENPYRQEDDDDEDTESFGQAWPNYSPQSEYSASRNGSTTSLRSRSTTGESGPPAGGAITMRMPPPRLPPGSMGGQGLTLRTQQLSTYERLPDSYFSPTVETPMSSRNSSTSSMYPFPRQPLPANANAYYEEGHSRYTAPVMSRIPSRENTNVPNGYPASARGPGPRPGYPAAAGMHSSQQIPPSRNRSASSPDINAQRRAMSAPRPPMPEGPLPLHHAQHMTGSAPRSQSNSPSMPNGAMPRVTNSPKVLRERSSQHPMQEPPHFAYESAAGPRHSSLAHSRSSTPSSYQNSPVDTAMSPLSTSTTISSTNDAPHPTQLKVKVHAPTAGQVLTLVVPLNITYQSLKDRIDAKLQRSTNISLTDRTSNQVKLKYLDEEDYVIIASDEDVQVAFETWREQRGVGFGGLGEIELFCQ